MAKEKTPGRIFFRIAVAGFELALLGAVAGVGAGFGARMRWWGFRFGFMMLAWTAAGGAVSAGVSLLGAVGAFFTLEGRRRLVAALAALGVAMGLAVFYVPWHWRQEAKKAPVIHDITTDAENPPQFSAVLQLRKDAPNGTDYQGAGIFEMQRRAYPDIQPLVIQASHADAFRKALDAAGKMRWEIAAADLSEGRIEAVDTTFWFGFKDDVVVRLTPVEGGLKTRVDVRSASRVGRSDIGTNARRIRAYLNLLKG